MNIKPIRTKSAYKQAMARIDELWGAPAGSAQGDELEVLAILVERYEAQHEPMPPSNPIEAIKFRMEQQRLAALDLIPYIGPSGRVSDRPSSRGASVSASTPCGIGSRACAARKARRAPTCKSSTRCPARCRRRCGWRDRSPHPPPCH